MPSREDLVRRTVLTGALGAAGGVLGGCFRRSVVDLGEVIAEARQARRRRVTLTREQDYVISAPIDLDGISVEGAGAVARVRRDFRGDYAITASSAVSIQGLQIAGTSSGRQKVDGIVLRDGACASTLTDVAVSGFSGSGVVVRGSVGRPRARGGLLRKFDASGCGRGALFARVHDLRVETSRFSANSSSGAEVVRSSRVRLKGSSFLENGRGDRARDGLVVLYSRHVTVEECVASSNGRRGISAGGGSPHEMANFEVQVVSCTVEDNGDHGVTFDPTIRGREGVSVDVGGRVVDCTLRRNGGSGINISSAGRVRVEGNLCEANDLNGIAAASRDVRIVRNKLIGNHSHGIALYGTSEGSQYGKYRLVGNKFRSNAKGDLWRSPRLAPKDAVVT